MKKFYLVFLILICLSCSKDDESSNSAISINPPAWLHGNWADADFEENGPIFKISSDDIIWVVGNSETSYKGQFELMAKSGEEVGVDEVVTQDSYKVTFHYTEAFTYSYSFSKIDDTTISWDDDGMGGVELTKL